MLCVPGRPLFVVGLTIPSFDHAGACSNFSGPAFQLESLMSSLYSTSRPLTPERPLFVLAFSSLSVENVSDTAFFFLRIVDIVLYYLNSCLRVCCSGNLLLVQDTSLIGLFDGVTK